jgi:hypothetical protein
VVVSGPQKQGVGVSLQDNFGEVVFCRSPEAGKVGLPLQCFPTIPLICWNTTKAFLNIKDEKIERLK